MEHKIITKCGIKLSKTQIVSVGGLKLVWLILVKIGLEK
jgi:hypothetical protein